MNTETKAAVTVAQMARMCGSFPNSNVSTDGHGLPETQA